jgi:oxygen-independent coproporphyrinogen-3 oxidase
MTRATSSGPAARAEIADQPLGLYVHVPFCAAICNYCNFNRGLFDSDLKTRYVRAVLDEISAAADGSPADTIFFGGART